VKTRLATIGLAAAALALVVVAAAAAENYQYKIVARDKATAGKVALQRSDLGGLTGWAGGAVKPDRSPETEDDRCNGYLPRQSDLVVTGDAETKYTYQGTIIDTQIDVLRTPAMVATDWQRSIDHPGYLACARQSAARELPKGERLVSLTKLPYSTFGTKSVAYRALINVTRNGRTFRVALDFVGFYRGRTEVSVIISGGAPRAADLLVLKALDLRVADIVNAKTPAA
jgi:microcompartment protein CcmK/EutM